MVPLPVSSRTTTSGSSTTRIAVFFVTHLFDLANGFSLRELTTAPSPATGRPVRAGHHHHPAHPALHPVARARCRSPTAAASLAILLYTGHNLTAAIVALVDGAWIDRWGPRPVFAAGAAAGR
jgi:hypothetical protein